MRAAVVASSLTRASYRWVGVAWSAASQAAAHSAATCPGLVVTVSPWVVVGVREGGAARGVPGRTVGCQATVTCPSRTIQRRSRYDSPQATCTPSQTTSTVHL